ncbi:MAG: hypothetical protein PF569_07930 [Candidatus Woesearchaeota archaeon]|jgi:hypothetical protein|nr:hypothetical protein [Candidatus Woesearchaeota archaeon]
MNKLPKSKYDEHGRPIKKSFFPEIKLESKYSNLDNSYSSKRYIKEDSSVENYKSSLSQKYNILEQKFKKEHPQLDQYGNEFKPINPELLIYYLILLPAFILVGLGFLIGLGVLMKTSNKIGTKEFLLYKPIRQMAMFIVVYQLIVMSIFGVVLFSSF